MDCITFFLICFITYFYCLKHPQVESQILESVFILNVLRKLIICYWCEIFIDFVGDYYISINSIDNFLESLLPITFFYSQDLNLNLNLKLCLKMHPN